MRIAGSKVATISWSVHTLPVVHNLHNAYQNNEANLGSLGCSRASSFLTFR